MRLYALIELHDPEAIELFITEEDARRALEDCLRDQPSWRGPLEVTRARTNTLRSTSYFDANNELILLLPWIRRAGVPRAG